MESGQIAYNALLCGGRYIAPPLSSDVPVKEKEASPQHHIETVTGEELLAAKKAWEKDFRQLPKLKQEKNVV